MAEEVKKKSNKKVIIIVVAALVVLAAIFGVIYFIFRPQATIGAKAITVEVVDNNGVTKTYNHNTDAEFLRAALAEIDGLIIEGDESDFGLYIKSVNGLSAVYETDNAYWALYTNDQYATNGVDGEPVVDGSTYALKYESASAFTE